MKVKNRLAASRKIETRICINRNFKPTNLSTCILYPKMEFGRFVSVFIKTVSLNFARSVNRLALLVAVKLLDHRNCWRI